MNYSAASTLSSIRPGNKTGDPTVNDVKCLRYSSNGQIEFKTQHTEPWQILPKRRQQTCAKLPVKQLHSSSLKIKRDKFDDLQSLKAVILPDYHNFYDNLEHW